MRKLLLASISALAILAAGSMTVYAGEWKQDDKGWWYQKDDGSYPVSTWERIDTNGDGLDKGYYFNSDGYLLTDSVAPDGYQVNGEGALISSGRIMVMPSLESFEALTESFPDMFIPIEDIENAYIQGTIDVGDLSEYKEGISKFALDKCGEVLSIFAADIRDIDISRLRQIIKDLESVDFNGYKNTNSLFARKMVAIDEWHTKAILMYCKDFMSLYENGIIDPNTMWLNTADLIDIANIEIDLYEEMAEFLLKAATGELRRR